MEEEKPPRYVPTEMRGWIRDTETGAILSVDRLAKKEHQVQVSQQRAQKSEINNLKSQVSELSRLVEKLIEDK